MLEEAPEYDVFVMSQSSRSYISCIVPLPHFDEGEMCGGCVFIY